MCGLFKMTFVAVNKSKDPFYSAQCRLDKQEQETSSQGKDMLSSVIDKYLPAISGQLEVLQRVWIGPSPI